MVFKRFLMCRPKPVTAHWNKSYNNNTKHNSTIIKPINTKQQQQHKQLTVPFETSNSTRSYTRPPPELRQPNIGIIPGSKSSAVTAIVIQHLTLAPLQKPGVLTRFERAASQTLASGFLYAAVLWSLYIYIYIIMHNC